MRRLAIAVILMLTVVSQAHAVKAEPYTVHDTVLGTCKIEIAVPATWNKCVVILAHGLRPECFPLTAEFDVKGVFAQSLLKDGWLIASTSYRRNGYIVGDAAEDVDRLRQYVAATYGKPKLVVLDGGSMGGAVIARLADTKKGVYDGALVIGLALPDNQSDPQWRLLFRPGIPILFLSNQNELSDPQRYIAQIDKSSARPAVWFVKRDGHCNVRDVEELDAFKALVTYIHTGKIAQNRDATQVPPIPVSTAIFKDGGAYSKLVPGGNMRTEFTASDLQKLGISQKTKFLLSFKDKTVKVFFGITYSDVSNGEWIAFMDAEGHLRVARNFENARGTLGCTDGDTIFIRALHLGE